MMNQTVRDLSKILDIRDKNAILSEVKDTTVLIVPGFNFSHFDAAFSDVNRLFAGKYEGYRQCNTQYHDFRHTMLVLLAMVRLMHGASLQGTRFSEKEVNLGLISALMHDSGYIQSADDRIGTGAKYTLLHISRSIKFVRLHYAEHDYFADDIKNFRNIMSCTGIHTMVADVEFENENMALLGKMLGTADLLGQMADRLYLEKLILLYSEFDEGGIQGFDSESDLLRKTVSFYNQTRKRFENEYGNVNRFMIHHFKERWNIDRDMYEESIENNINYLKFVLKNSQKNITDALRRNTVLLQ